MTLRLRVDEERCINVEMCTDAAPNVFAMNDRGKSSIVDPAGDPNDAIWEAAQGCPVSAIYIEDEKTGEQLFP